MTALPEPNPTSPSRSEAQQSQILNPQITYQVGGSLREDSATYVVRQADHDLYTGLTEGLFCYILNSRQMGKSSLRVRTMARLKAEGYTCVAFEMREICIYKVNADEFYGGFVSHLASEFELSIDLEAWWNQQSLLHPFLRLGRFIEDILLTTISTKIVIFIDEIDSILNLEFKDDFFAFLRSCYHKRTDKPQFQRLNFACLGVATPVDLIADSHFTSLNLDSRGIELMGFQLTEAQPLTEGLRPRAANPEAVMAAILAWTGGQPFLTQWVCQIIQQSNQMIPSGTEAHWVEQWVRSQIITSWRTSDRQQHFQTIRDRILHGETFTCWALGLYQQLLNQGEFTVEDSPELMQFRLSGLVVKRQNKLRIYNRIYASIFDQTWAEQALRKIRPYGPEFTAWELSQEQSYLLRDDRLQAALKWAKGLSLSHGDYQFLSASQTEELHAAQQKINQAVNQEKQALERLGMVQQKTHWRLRLGALVLGLSIAGTLGTLLYFGRSDRQLRQRTQILNLEREGTRILQGQSDANQIINLVSALNVAQDLKDITEQYALSQWPVYTPLFALQSVLDNIHEKNRWSLGVDRDPIRLSFSPIGSHIAVGFGDGSIGIWTLKGTQVQMIPAYQSSQPNPAAVPEEWPLALSWSRDGRRLVSSSTGLTIDIWDVVTGQRIRSLNVDGEPIADLQFSPNENLVAVNAKGRVFIWSPQGQLIHTLQLDVTLPAGTTASDYTLSEAGDAVIYTKILADGQGYPEVRSLQTGKLLQQYPTIRYRPSEQVLHAFRSRTTTASQRYTSLTLNRLTFWNPDGSIKSQIQTHPGFATDFSYSPQGDRIATIHPDGLLKLWQLNAEGTLRSHADPLVIPRLVRVEPASRPNPNLSESRPASISPTSTPPSQTSLSQSALNPQAPSTVPPLNILSQQVPLGTTNPPTTISGPNSPQQHPAPAHPAPAFKPPKHRLISLSLNPKTQEVATLNLEGELKIYGPKGNLQSQIETGNSGADLQYSPSGSHLILQSLAPQKTLEIRTGKGQLLQRIFPTSYKPMVEISPDGRLMAIAGEKPDILELWSLDATLSKNLKLLKDADELRFNLKEPTFLTLTSPNVPKPLLTLWNLQGDRLKDLSIAPAGVINTLKASPNGQFMAADSGGNLTAWSAQGDPLYTLNHGAGITDIVYSQSGKIFATVGMNQTIKIWQSEDRGPYRLLQTIENVPGWIMRLQFSPNGQLLAAKSIDSKIYIWEANGEFIAQLDVGGSLNNLLSFSADGQRLFSTGGTQLRSWNLNLDNLIREGCDWLQDYLHTHASDRQRLPQCKQG